MVTGGGRVVLKGAESSPGWMERELKEGPLGRENVFTAPIPVSADTHSGEQNPENENPGNTHGVHKLLQIRLFIHCVLVVVTHCAGFFRVE